MKKALKIIAVVIIVIPLVIVLAQKYYINYYVKIYEEGKYYKIIYKGLEKAKDFTEDNQGTFYFAFKNSIQSINKNGISYNLLKNSKLDIMSIEYCDGKLYFSSGDSIFSYDLSKKILEKLFDDIPNFGDYKDVLIKIKNGYLYASIGSATNSGVVGPDNTWLIDNPFAHDITPKVITISGQMFGGDTTGAFTPYNTKNIKGQIIPEHFPGNSSVIIYNLKTHMSENYAYGIRNIKGMDFNSEGKLIAAVGGMENRGLRPVKGDSDYIFSIEKSKWYGWPDYSGGEPVTSDKFIGINNKKISFILEQHPTTNPPKPLYKSDSLNNFGTLAIDTAGTLNNKNTIYFYDCKSNEIKYYDNVNKCKTIMSFPNTAYIRSIKFDGERLMLLNSKEGYFMLLSSKNMNSSSAIDKKPIYILFAAIVSGIFCIITICIFLRIKGR